MNYLEQANPIYMNYLEQANSQSQKIRDYQRRWGMGSYCLMGTCVSLG